MSVIKNEFVDVNYAAESIICCVLHNISNIEEDCKNDCFFLEKISQSFSWYVNRLRVYIGCAEFELIGAVIILARVSVKMKINKNNIHKLFLTCLLISRIILTDYINCIKIFSKVGNVSVKELKVMEYNLLKILDWNVNITAIQYARTCKYLTDVIRHPPKECSCQLFASDHKNEMGYMLYCNKRTHDTTYTNLLSEGSYEFSSDNSILFDISHI
jgi:hypothetical protein